MSTLGQTLLILVNALCALIGVDPAHSDVSRQDNIFLDQPVHFSAPDGSDVLTAPGSYIVKAAAPGLQLIPEKAGNSTGVYIEAITAHLDVEANDPVALAIRVHEDEYHILLLMPGRTLFEAVGSSSGILTRGAVFKPLTGEQVKAALRARHTSSK